MIFTIGTDAIRASEVIYIMDDGHDDDTEFYVKIRCGAGYDTLTYELDNHELMKAAKVNAIAAWKMALQQTYGF